jgi:hypothetical protein
VNWRPALPELVIAAIAVTAAALAAGAVAGWPGVAAVVVAVAVIALLMLRVIVPHAAAQTLRMKKAKQRARAIHGYAQRKFVIANSLTTGQVYEADLRPVLEHVLAARLSENHAVNLYNDPEAARQAFCRTRRDASLWRWIDPVQAPAPSGRAPRSRAIPRRTLARLITRLEQL